MTNTSFPRRMVAWLALVTAVSFAPAAARSDEAPLAEHAPSYIYKTVGDRQLKVDVDYPPDWKKTDSRPAIVFYSGGGFRSGGTAAFTTQAAYFAKRGLVAVRAEYRDRTRDDANVTMCLEDAISSFRWVRKHAAELGIDPDRIVASGGSAGGFLASSLAGTRGFAVEGDDESVSHVPNALVLFNPVVDLTRPESSDPTSETSVMKQISAAHNLTSQYPPTIILIGSKDGFFEQVDKFVNDAKALGVNIEMDVTEGQPHAFFNRHPWHGQTAVRADQFLQSIGYLAATPAVDPPTPRSDAARRQEAKSKTKSKKSKE